MDEKLFRELMESAHEALAHARGKQELRTTVLPPPPPPMNAVQVKRLRAGLHLFDGQLLKELGVPFLERFLHFFGNDVDVFANDVHGSPFVMSDPGTARQGKCG